MGRAQRDRLEGCEALPAVRGKETVSARLVRASRFPDHRARARGGSRLALSAGSPISTTVWVCAECGHRAERLSCHHQADPSLCGFCNP